MIDKAIEYGINQDTVLSWHLDCVVNKQGNTLYLPWTFVYVVFMLLALLNFFAAASCPRTLFFNDKISVYREYGLFPNGTGVLVLTVYSTSPGWASFGYSPNGKMAGATVYTAWMNSAKQPMLQPGLAQDNGMPTYSSEIQATILNRNDTWVFFAGSSVLSSMPMTLPIGYKPKIKVSFLVSESNKNFGGLNRYIWAVSSTPPAQIDSISSSYSKHDEFGVFSADFKCTSGCDADCDPTTIGALLKRPADWTKSTVVIYHAVFMYLAWFIFPVCGIYVAAFMKHIGHKWYQIHMLLFIAGTCLFSGVGLFFIYAFKTVYGFPTFGHGILGVIISVCLVVQVLLGFLINYLYKPDRSKTPWHDYFHRYFGRILAILAIVNIVLGLFEATQRYDGTFAILGIPFIFLTGSAIIALLIYHKTRQPKISPPLLSNT